MCHQVIHGQLCRDERFLRRYVAPVGLVIMVAFGLLLFKEALRCKISVTHWVFAIGWLVSVIWLIVLYRKIRVADKVEFSLEQGRILNSWPRNNEIELFLYESYFYTVLTCEFGYGKATKEKSFYLFSKAPICCNNIKGQGLFVLENLRKSNVIIVPKNDETQIWLNAALKINNIPIFPNVAFKQGGDK